MPPPFCRLGLYEQKMGLLETLNTSILHKSLAYKTRYNVATYGSLFTFKIELQAKLTFE